jgi:hypothetical protein
MELISTGEIMALGRTSSFWADQEIAGMNAAKALLNRNPQFSFELCLELGRGAMATRNQDYWAQGFQRMMEIMAPTRPRRSTGKEDY